MFDKMKISPAAAAGTFQALSSAESLAVHNCQRLDGPARNRVRLVREDAAAFPNSASLDTAARLSTLSLSGGAGVGLLCALRSR